MSLLGEVRAEQGASRVGGICGVKRVLDALDDADRADLLTALDADPGDIMHATIVRVLKARGFEVGRESIANHRKGICKCR